MKQSALCSMITPLVATAIGLAFLTGSAAAQSETVLFRFAVSSDSGNPSSGLISDRHGNFYGTTNLVNGAVYELSPPTQNGPWTESVLYFFQGGSDGYSPSSNRLAMDAKGNLYGSNAFGGIVNSTTCSQGCGTVYELSPPAETGNPWVETILYSFPGGTGGTFPVGVTLAPNGWLIVPVESGTGSAKNGFVLALEPPAISGDPWSKHLVYEFQSGSDGSGPNSSFLIDKNLNLYSTTQAGGSSNCTEGGCGTVYELTPSDGGSHWTKTTLYAFQGPPNDGAIPTHGLLFDDSGTLYGTTFVGGPTNFGTAFQLAPPARVGSPWTETVLHSFGVSPDGIYPSGVAIDPAGNLYGGTDEGGSGLFAGGIFYELSPPSESGGAWTETVLHNFPSSTNDGDGLSSPPLFRGGALYGTTAYGGNTRACSPGCGTVYAIRP